MKLVRLDLDGSEVLIADHLPFGGLYAGHPTVAQQLPVQKAGDFPA
jgi:hypothetical protein